MMEQDTQAVPAHNFDQLPDLPNEITLWGGRVVTVSGYVWRLPLSVGLPRSTVFNWRQLLDVTSHETSQPIMSERAVRLVMLFIIEKLHGIKPKAGIKSRSAHNNMRSALYLTRWLSAHPEWLLSGRSFEWSDMTEDLFSAWLTSAYHTNRKGSDAIFIRSFYRWGVKKCLPDFSRPLSSALDTLNIKAPPIGEVVAGHDPRRGAFTSEEMDLIFTACKSGKGTDHDRAITWTLLDTFIRPEQIYHLKNRDLVLRDDGHGDSDANDKYCLRVRMLKQRDPEPRYVELPMSEQCFGLLRSLRRSEDGPDDRLFWWITNGFRQYINKRLKAFIKAADLRSPRLPVENPSPGQSFYELLPINPCRFRYGMATERIAQGETEANVSLSLCHTSRGAVRFYAKTSSSIADDFQQATDYAILPLVHRMEGRRDDLAGEIQLRRNTAGESSSREGMPFTGGDAALQFGRKRAAERTVLPADADKTAARIAEMVATARRRFLQLYPGQRFDAQVWDVRHRLERPHATRLKSFGFTTLESTKHEISRHRLDALPDYFANVIKSWIVLDGHLSASYDARRLTAARHFWNFISGRVDAGEFFRWSSLTESDFIAFEYHLRSYKSTVQSEPLGAETILGNIALVQRLAYFLAGRGICREIDYIPLTVSQRAVSTQTLRGKELAAEQKLPTPGVLEAFADIYYRLTTAPAGEVDDYTLIRIFAVAILMFTGIRLGELLTLPFDCEVEDKTPAQESGEAVTHRYGLRYWVEKTQKKTLRVKWISSTAEPIVREAVRRIKDLTANARCRAKILEDNPDEVPLPADVANLLTITRNHLISLLGYKDGSHLSHTSRSYLPRHEVDGKIYYHVEDVKAFLLSTRVPELYTFRCEGTVQMLSESLLVVFYNQAKFKRTGKCDLLVQPLKEKSIGYFLSPAMGSNGPCLTVFSEFGLTEEERALATNPHAFRHWLIHTAYQGGMPEHLVMRYFEKQFGSDIEDYIHFVPEETDPYVPDELRAEYAVA